MPMVLFGGFISNTATTPAWLAWIQWISPIRYANEALAQSQYDSYGKGTLTYAYLKLEGFDLGYWNCIVILAVFALFWRMLSVIFLTCGITKFQ